MASTELQKAVESLEVELQNITIRAVDIKRTINQILLLNGGSPKYADVDTEVTKSDVQARQFLGKEMLDAVKEVMRTRGRKPASAQEILDGLTQGDFTFPDGWKKKLKLKNMAIYLGSRKDDFVWFETKGGKVYGLAEQYPDRKKELDRLSKGKGNNLAGEELPPEDAKT